MVSRCNQAPCHMKRHMQTHTGAGFFQSDILKSHMQTHTGKAIHLTVAAVLLGLFNGTNYNVLFNEFGVYLLSRPGQSKGLLC